MSAIPLASILRHHARRRPGAIAIRQETMALTWEELEARANRRARMLAAHGVAAGDFVTVALPNSPEFFESTFAIWKLGATPNPVSAKLPAREFDAIMNLVRPKAVIGASPASMGTPVIPIDVDTSGYASDALEEPVARYWKAMTSGGSTGRPKVIVDHQPALLDPESPPRHQPRDGVMLNPGPLCHNAPFISVHTALSIGCTIVNMPRFDAEHALQLIAQHRVQWVCFVPTMMKRIWDLPTEVRGAYDVSSLRTVWHMAAPIAPWLKEAWIRWLGAEKIWELYGATERLAFAIIDGAQWLAHRGSVGLVQGGAQLKIVGESGEPCKPGEIGEIFMKPPVGAGQTYHYVGAEPRRRDDGWESIGDLGWLDEEGYLYLADRRVDLILRGGANIYPAEVEAALEQHPAVASSIVLGLPDEDLGQRVHAIVEPHPCASGMLDAIALTAFLADRIAPYKLPESYEIAAQALRDDAGKTRRAALRAQRIAWMSEGREFRLSVR